MFFANGEFWYRIGPARIVLVFILKSQEDKQGGF
jgi:hypothetical protein